MYLKNSFSSNVQMKHNFYTFKMDQYKNHEQNLDDFKRLISDLVTIDHIVEDEIKTNILLNYLPKKYKEVKLGIICGRNKVSLDMVISNLKSKDL